MIKLIILEGGVIMATELLSLLGHAVVDAVVIVVKSKSGK